MGLGEEEEGEGLPVKLGQEPRLRCSEAVLEGFDAEKTALQSEHRILAAFGTPDSVVVKMGSRCAQYHAPFPPLIALVRIVSSASYRLLAALADASSLPAVVSAITSNTRWACPTHTQSPSPSSVSI